MTEENIPLMEIHVEQGCYKAIVRVDSWPRVLAQARVAKMQIAELTCHEMGYDFTENQWHLSIPKKFGSVRNRISCALCLNFPLRITREELEVLSSANMVALRNYLTKSELEIQPNIDETEEGIRLNELGYKWATGILTLLEGNDDKEEVNEDDE